MFPSTLAEAQLRYCVHPAALRPGNAIRLFAGGDAAFDCMLRGIAAARQEIHLETYILAGDRTGEMFRDALMERARAGVAVRVMLDGFGSATLSDAFLRPLKDAGARVLEFRPLGPWRSRWGWRRRNHRKILVVDRWNGFTGGLNISDEYRSAAQGGGNWQDVHLQVMGPAAADLNALFVETWTREAGPPIPRHLPPTSAVQDAMVAACGGLATDIPALVIGNHRSRLRHAIRNAYLHAIGQARRRILLANAYFIPDLRIRRSLQAAVRRGVDVRVMVAEKTDIAPIYYASRATFQGLLSAGVKIWEMVGAVLHAKCAVVDGQWAIVGSYNLDHRSLFHNLEATLTFVDAPAAARVEEVLAAQLPLCRAVDPALWPARPWQQKLLEQFWYFLREIL